VTYRIGVDVGGTFTDFLVSGRGNGSNIYKVLSSPTDPSRAVFTGLEQIASDFGLPLGEFLGEVEAIVHGTTITTNATLTKTGERIGMLTTDGFRDVLLMRRGMRERQYDCKHSPPPPIVPRSRICVVKERVAYDGTTLVPLDEESVRAAARQLRDDGVTSIGVCYLFAFFNHEHEQRTLEIVAEEIPGAFVTLSSEVLPQVRLYERMSTTALNAYVRPPLDRYLDGLQTRLVESGFQGTLLIMQSNGGVTTPDGASRHAVNTLLSGPAAGPVSGLAAAREFGIDDIITIDMGGTSFDACLVAKGEPQLSSESELAGYFIGTPSLDIRVIGAGGGSIASVDAGGLLHVGPASASADPGPACYGRGGPATVTDADLLLGYLDAHYFHGGELRLDVDAAERAMEAVARALGMSLQDAAAGVYEVVNANMANALRIVSMQRGYDPREFGLVVAGGAGPIHAAALAGELEIPVTLIPRNASVFCAVGMLLTDLKHDYVRTFAAPTDQLDASGLDAPLGAMRDESVETLRSEGVAEEDVEIRFSADMRYIGQFSEVEVSHENPVSIEQLVADFHLQHNRQFGYSLPGSPTEIVNLRARSRGWIGKPELTHAAGSATPDDALKGTRSAWFGREEFETRIYDALSLGSGSRIDGPAIFEQPTTTIVVPPEFRLQVEKNMFLLLRKSDDLDAVLDRLRA
jgi:N-methylhydantoinase A